MTCDEEALDGQALHRPVGQEVYLDARVAQIEGQGASIYSRCAVAGGSWQLRRPTVQLWPECARWQVLRLCALLSTNFAQRETSGTARANAGAGEAMFQEAELEATAGEEVGELEAHLSRTQFNG